MARGVGSFQVVSFEFVLRSSKLTEDCPENSSSPPSLTPPQQCHPDLRSRSERREGSAVAFPSFRVELRSMQDCPENRPDEHGSSREPHRTSRRERNKLAQGGP